MGQKLASSDRSAGVTEAQDSSHRMVDEVHQHHDQSKNGDNSNNNKKYLVSTYGDSEQVKLYLNGKGELEKIDFYGTVYDKSQMSRVRFEETKDGFILNGDITWNGQPHHSIISYANDRLTIKVPGEGYEQTFDDKGESVKVGGMTFSKLDSEHGTVHVTRDGDKNEYIYDLNKGRVVSPDGSWRRMTIAEVKLLKGGDLVEFAIVVTAQAPRAVA